MVFCNSTLFCPEELLLQKVVWMSRESHFFWPLRSMFYLNVKLYSDYINCDVC
jgi:hypothetical protein